MCGRCRHPFNAFESLQRIDDTPAHLFTDDVVDGDQPTSVASKDEQAQRDIESPPPMLDEPFDSYEAAVQKISQLAPAKVMPTHAVNNSVADDNTPDNDSPFVTVSTTSSASEEALLNPPTNAPASPESVYHSTNPLITGEVPRERRPSRAWPWLMTLASLTLVAQLLYFYRSEIVQHYPQLRPHFVTACGPFGCSVGWRRDDTQFGFADSTLLETPGKPGQYLVTAILQNRAAFMQDYPHLELRLTDTNNNLLSSRILAPPEYLGRKPRSEEGVAANSELYINLRLELSGKPAAGYGLRPLYP